MKTNSNTVFPTSPTKWKDGEYVVYINHKDNGIQPEGDEGKRHEAEFTISTGIDDASIATAFERHFADPEHDQNVLDTIEVEGRPAIEIVKTYPENLPKIKSAGILLDESFVKLPDEIKVLSGDADTNIRKLAGNIKNYVADLRDGKRTSATDKEVEQLIADNNVLITVQ